MYAYTNMPIHIYIYNEYDACILQIILSIHKYIYIYIYTMHNIYIYIYKYIYILDVINLLDDELQPVAWKWLAYTLPHFKSCRTAWRNWVSLMAQACTRKSSRRSRPFEGMSTKPLRHVGQGLRTHSCALWLSVLPESGQVYRGDQGSPSAFSQVDLMFASSYGSNILGSIHRWLRWSQFNSRS